MSTDFDVICLTCDESMHLGQRFSSGPCFGFGSNDNEGRTEAATFIADHLGHDLRIAESESDPSGCARCEEMQATFDLRWKADMRGIKMWQESTGESLTWPDHADLVVFLLEKLEPLTHLQERINEIFGCDVSISVALKYIRSWRQTWLDDFQRRTNEANAICDRLDQLKKPNPKSSPRPDFIPGRWEAFNPGRHFVQSMRNFKSVCELTEHDGWTTEQVIATTKLIAAAPDMYDALLIAIEMLEECGCYVTFFKQIIEDIS